MEELKNAINLKSLIGFYKTLLPTTAEYTFKDWQNINQDKLSLGHKKYPHKFKKNKNHTECVLQPQWNQTRNQYKKNREIPVFEDFKITFK